MHSAWGNKKQQLQKTKQIEKEKGKKRKYITDYYNSKLRKAVRVNTNYTSDTAIGWGLKLTLVLAVVALNKQYLFLKRQKFKEWREGFTIQPACYLAQYCLRCGLSCLKMFSLYINLVSIKAEVCCKFMSSSWTRTRTIRPWTVR